MVIISIVDTLKQLKPPRGTASLLLSHLVNEIGLQSLHFSKNSRNFFHFSEPQKVCGQKTAEAATLRGRPRKLLLHLAEETKRRQRSWSHLLTKPLLSRAYVLEALRNHPKIKPIFI